MSEGNVMLIVKEAGETGADLFIIPDVEMKKLTTDYARLDNGNLRHSSADTIANIKRLILLTGTTWIAPQEVAKLGKGFTHTKKGAWAKYRLDNVVTPFTVDHVIMVTI